MYELYLEDYDNSINWSYDYFFEHYTALEYYVDKANLILRKRKIEKIKNGLQSI
jgi:hypothetical protein